MKGISNDTLKADHYFEKNIFVFASKVYAMYPSSPSRSSYNDILGQ